jgi:hypothetical protein
MRILSRLEKLENATIETDGVKLCMVYKNEQEDKMEISMFEYSGNIKGGQKIMDEHPNCLFVIMNMSLKTC